MRNTIRWLIGPLVPLLTVACGLASEEQAARPTPQEVPYYFIAIHNEPCHFPGGRRALEVSYRTLAEMVERADKFHVKLTLMFAPQWADFISESTERMTLLTKWKTQGHEIAGHHHSIYHGNWDGYTNYPPEHALAERARHTARPEQHLGTLADFLQKLRKIEPALQCGCMNDEFDKQELPSGIICDTCSGFANFGPPGRRVEDGVAPEKGKNEYVSVGHCGGVKRYWLAHYQITTHERRQVAQQVFRSMSRGVYGVVTHSIQSQAVPYCEFLDFLHSRDPAGERSRTVSAVIREKLLPEKVLPDELLRAAHLPPRKNVGPPEKADAEIFQLVAELKQLLGKRRAEGMDVSKALELDEQSRAAFQAGNKEQCRKLLQEAIDLLKDRSEK